MIPQQTPVKNHWGNNSDTVFDFDFYIENEEQLLVTHTDFEGNVTTLTLGVDYSINSVGNTNGSSINFPLAESRYSTLAWDTSTDAKELLTISLDIPIEQPAEYSMSGDLNKKNLEYSLDYLTRLIQILYRQISRTIKIAEGSSQSVDEFIAELQSGNNLAKKWASYMEGSVDGSEFSSKYYASSAQSSAEQAEEQANKAAEYAAAASVGLTLISFSENDWIENDGLYTLTLDIPAAVGVYNEQRQLIFNIDIQCVDNQTVLTALEAFDGYVLCTANSDSENEDDNEFTEEELEELIVDTWEDIETEEP